MIKRKIDLHLHTPASKDYKGSKDDKEYLDILRKCYEDSIETIAITDHNTICGYKKFIEIRDNLKIILSNASTTDAPHEYIESLKRNYSYFKKVRLFQQKVEYIKLIKHFNCSQWHQLLNFH